MPGRGKIDEYNKSLTPEERKLSAKRAATAPRPKARLNSNIRRIAKAINKAPAGTKLKEALEMLNVDGEDFSNAAGIALAVFQAAIDGDMRAVEKWEKYVGQEEMHGDGGVRIVDDL